jgi:hypothetical protein
MAATKTKKRSTAKKAPAKKTEVPDNPFAPGVKVGFYPPEEAEFVRTDEREPPSKPAAEATVAKDGTLEVSGLKPGTYIAVGQVAETGGRFGARFGQLTFVVK